MVKKILFSANKEHDIIKGIISHLQEIQEIDLILHDPFDNFLDLEKMSNNLENVDFMIVKVVSDTSLDLLHYAKLYKIPTLHDVDTVLLCKNKVSLDYTLRKIFNENKQYLGNFFIPKSWTHSLLNVDSFKEWASDKLPLVIKSHYQHDKFMRFNFLVREIEEIDIFYKKYEKFLTYDVYIQEFIKCDGMDRKVYVIGDKNFGIKRENPIYIYLREQPDSIDCTKIEREEFDIPETFKILAKIISDNMNLKLFGFDLVKPINREGYGLIDLNDFPGFRGIENIEKEISNYIKNYVLN